MRRKKPPPPVGGAGAAHREGGLQHTHRSKPTNEPQGRTGSVAVFDGRIALLALVGLAASIPLRQFILLFPLFGGYLAIYLATSRCFPILPAARFGDLSYGLYIYGWPVQAMVIHAMGGKAAWWQLFLVALPLAMLAAWLSWHLVEKHFLRLKPGRAQARPLAAPERSAMAAPWPLRFPSAAISRSSTAPSPR